MNDEMKTTLDAGSLGIMAAALLELLPQFVLITTLVWTCIRIWETKTVQYWWMKVKQWVR